MQYCLARCSRITGWCLVLNNHQRARFIPARTRHRNREQSRHAQGRTPALRSFLNLSPVVAGSCFRSPPCLFFITTKRSGECFVMIKIANHLESASSASPQRPLSWFRRKVRRRSLDCRGGVFCRNPVPRPANGRRTTCPEKYSCTTPFQRASPPLQRPADEECEPSPRHDSIPAVRPLVTTRQSAALSLRIMRHSINGDCLQCRITTAHCRLPCEIFVGGIQDRSDICDLWRCSKLRQYFFGFCFRCFIVGPFCPGLNFSFEVGEDVTPRAVTR